MLFRSSARSAWARDEESTTAVQSSHTIERSFMLPALHGTAIGPVIPHATFATRATRAKIRRGSLDGERGWRSSAQCTRRPASGGVEISNEFKRPLGLRGTGAALPDPAKLTQKSSAALAQRIEPGLCE